MKTIYDYDYMDMNLRFAYRFLNKQSILTTAHNHNYYEYFLVTSGSITHIVNDSKQHLGKGDLVLIRPSDYHSYRLSENNDCEIINVSFSAQHFYSACQYLGVNVEQQFTAPLIPPLINISPFADCRLAEEHSFLHFFVGDNEELYARLRLLLIESLVTFIRYSHLKESQHYDEWLYRALEQMTSQENIEEGVPAFLRLTGYSHGHLCRIMKQQLGMSPNQYITKIRMVYAASLLQNSDNDILTISLKSGYSSLSHFIMTFKRHHGITPMKFREQHSNLKKWK